MYEKLSNRLYRRATNPAYDSDNGTIEKKNAKERNEENVGFSEIKDVTEELCRELL